MLSCHILAPLRDRLGAGLGLRPILKYYIITNNTCYITVHQTIQTVTTIYNKYSGTILNNNHNNNNITIIINKNT